MKIEAIFCPETSETNYCSTLCKIPKDRKSYSHTGGSLVLLTGVTKTDNEHGNWKVGPILSFRFRFKKTQPFVLNSVYMNVVQLKELGYSVYHTHLRTETLRKYEKNIFRSNYNEENEGSYNRRKSQRQNIEIRKFYIYPIFVVTAVIRIWI